MSKARRCDACNEFYVPGEPVFSLDGPEEKEGRNVMATFRELEAVAKAELQDELIAEKKELLKERIQELHRAKKLLTKLEKQYEELLAMPIEEDDEE